MKIKLPLSLAMIALLLSSCIDPVSYEFAGEEGLLVVDGLITDEPGPYVVKLSYSGMPEHISDARLTNAVVTIADDQGNQEVLEETEPGFYQTDASGIQGQINRTYQLTVNLESGEEYESEPETLVAVSSIDSIHFRYITGKINDIETSSEIATDGFEIYIDMTDMAQQGNYYKWKSFATYEHLSKDEVRTGPPPNPPPCCFVCFRRTEITKNIVLLGDAYFNGKEINNYPVSVVNNSEGSRALVEIKQYSLSLRAYNYWDQIRKQNEQGGGIFDSPPTNLIGNIKNANNNTKALGFFGASAVVSRKIMIYRNNFPSVTFRPVPTGDCRLLYPGSTAVAPRGF